MPQQKTKQLPAPVHDQKEFKELTDLVMNGRFDQLQISIRGGNIVFFFRYWRENLFRWTVYTRQEVSVLAAYSLQGKHQEKRKLNRADPTQVDTGWQTWDKI